MTIERLKGFMVGERARSFLHVWSFPERAESELDAPVPADEDRMELCADDGCADGVQHCFALHGGAQARVKSVLTMEALDVVSMIPLT